MRSLQRLLSRFGLARLKKFTGSFPDARRKYKDTRKLIIQNRDEFEKDLPVDFAWSYLYELEYKQLVLLSLACFGLLEKFIKAHEKGLDLNVFMMDEITRLFDSSDEDIEWSGGHEGKYTKSDLYAIHRANECTWRCLGIYGDYLNDLVKKVRNGEDEDDEAFFNAIRIDRTVLTSPTFSARLARAEFFGEKRFLQRLHKAIKEKPHDKLLEYQDMRNMLRVIQDLNMINGLSMKEADYLFIRELKLYQNTAGADRSLMRFIQRWKAQQSSTT
jgi:hypothetical protein